MIQVSCFGHYNVTPLGMKTEQRMCAACSEPITDKYLLQTEQRMCAACSEPITDKYLLQTEQRMCAACSEPITDKYLLQTEQRMCAACSEPITDKYLLQTEQRMCAACSEPITDKYLLQVSGRSWHAHCLRCCVCQLALDRQPSCFIKDDSVYCKADYAKSFGAKCSKCCRSISANDWVRKARDHVYHLACFACDACKRQLSTGEEFALHDDRVLCKAHYLETIDGTTTSSDEGGDSESYHSKSKAKRVRTTFTEEQLQVLQANFQLDSNPDGQDLERIAQITGLSKRVTQVWFQNSRARQKKHLNTGKMKSSHCHGAGMGGRELESGQFGRHINLHLTYSLQQQSKVSHIYSSHHPMSEPSSLDELSQDSMLMCTLRGEGV